MNKRIVLFTLLSFFVGFNVFAKGFISKDVVIAKEKTVNVQEIIFSRLSNLYKSKQLTKENLNFLREKFKIDNFINFLTNYKQKLALKDMCLPILSLFNGLVVLFGLGMAINSSFFLFMGHDI